VKSEWPRLRRIKFQSLRTKDNKENKQLFENMGSKLNALSFDAGEMENMGARIVTVPGETETLRFAHTGA